MGKVVFLRKIGSDLHGVNKYNFFKQSFLRSFRYLRLLGFFVTLSTLVTLPPEGSSLLVRTEINKVMN